MKWAQTKEKWEERNDRRKNWVKKRSKLDQKKKKMQWEIKESDMNTVYDQVKMMRGGKKRQHRGNRKSSEIDIEETQAQEVISIKK